MFIDFIENSLENNKEKIAIVYKDKEYTYSWLNENYLKWKDYIVKNNIYKNSIVAVEADFSPNSIGLLLAIIENNSIFVPLSKQVKNIEELKEIAQVEYCIKLEDNEVFFEKTNNEVSNELLVELKSRKHPGLVLFSSGTTGKPKGAVHDLLPMLEKYKRPGKAFKTITFLLFDHIGGINTLLHMISNGGEIVALENRSPEEVCRLIYKYKVELLPTSPTFVNMILFSRAYKKYDISSLNLVTYGTEPMPESTLKQFHELFPNIRLKQTYGLSELGIMRSKSESSESLWIKIGGEDFKTKIVDGKLWIKSKMAMLGYLNAPSPFDEDGWFNTNDVVMEKGEYIKILGRDTEIINVGGQKVYPAEVESVLLSIEDVLDASVFGVDNALMGKVVATRIRVNPENNNRQFSSKIKKICRERLDKYKIPVKITLTEDVLNSGRFKRLR